MRISMKFDPIFYIAMAAGRKFMTTRTTKHGKIGDTFFIKNKIRFVITGIQRMELQDIAREFYPMEGFNSCADFKEFWLTIHRKWTPNRMVYLHTFKRE
jgi:hypothetical protein